MPPSSSTDCFKRIEGSKGLFSGSSRRHHWQKHSAYRSGSGQNVTGKTLHNPQPHPLQAQQSLAPGAGGPNQSSQSIHRGRTPGSVRRRGELVVRNPHSLSSKRDRLFISTRNSMPPTHAEAVCGPFTTNRKPPPGRSAWRHSSKPRTAICNAKQPLSSKAHQIKP